MNFHYTAHTHRIHFFFPQHTHIINIALHTHLRKVPLPLVGYG